ncbi:MAG: prepilin-type N-terminal cleavage/methylation domain-containing protein [Planctomycetes bacterium]|nr:prepilin-type N-terminal cleavage/methylation domain-containing protein [Planctomycetota bacterium]
MRKSGLTLIEIMVVVALMSVVIGGGVALFNRAGKVNQTTAQTFEIKSILARARNTALSRNQRVEVAFDIINNQVLSYLRRPIAYLHFEDRDSTGSRTDSFNVSSFNIAGPGSILKASAVNNVRVLPFSGKDGNCLIFNAPTGGKSDPRPGYLKIPYNQVFDCSRGISVSCDFKIEKYPQNPMILVAKGSSLYLAISDEGTLFAGGSFLGQLIHKNKSVVGFPDSQQSDIDIYTRQRITLDKWHHVEMTFSNLGMRISLDGVLLEPFLGEELERIEIEEKPTAEVQTEKALALDSFFLPVYQMEFTIGGSAGGGESFFGLIDNLQIGEIQASETIQLMPDIRMFGEFGEFSVEEDMYNPGGISESYSFGKIWVHFGPDGFLDPAYHRNSVMILIRNQKTKQTKRITISTAGIVN